MDMRKSDEEPEFGILIYQLPRETVPKAMTLIEKRIKAMKLTQKRITRKTDTEFGLEVYFSRKEIADNYIKKKNIEIDGILFYIYPLVTCLTVYNTNDSITKETIEEYFKAKNLCVVDLYQINDTSDFRVVLNVPEVFANFQLSDSSFPNSNLSWGFFCRVCRIVGHKQYQCLLKEPTSSLNNNHTSNDSHNQMTSQNVDPRSSSSINFEKQNGSALSVPRSSQVIEGSQNTRAENNNIRNGIPIQEVDVEEVSIISNPSTFSTPTAAEGARMTQNGITTKKNRGLQGKTQSKSSSDKNRREKAIYPCRKIETIIKNVFNTQSSKICSFLREVHSKKNLRKYVEKYNMDIPDLIEKFGEVISSYYKKKKSPLASKHIAIIKRLHDRLNKEIAA